MNDIKLEDIDNVEIIIKVCCEFCGMEEEYYIDKYSHDTLDEGIVHALNNEGWGVYEGEEMIGVCCGCEL